MTYSLSNLINSVAGALSGLDYPVYDSQTQQGVETPCFFISLMPSEISGEPYDRYYNTVNLDIVFLQDPNIPNATDLIYTVIDYLNEHLALFDYSDGTETCKMHGLQRRHHLEEMDLHYQITIKMRIHIDVEETVLKTLEGITYEIKRKS